MTVDKAISQITRMITAGLAQYDQLAESKDALGARIPHALDLVTDEDKRIALETALTSVALSASPISLVETTGSTASELRRISIDYYIRVPNEPLVGEILDIDDGLSYAVIYKALSPLWVGFSQFSQEADSIINTYITAYRDYIEDLITGAVSAGKETYIRFSTDASNWHSGFVVGDIYISFKRIDTATWTTAIKFIGDKGADGASGTTGASSFLDLSDTPTALIAGKYLQVNTVGNALELVDAPIATTGLIGANVFGDNIFFDDTLAGTFTLDASAYNVFYLYPNATTELSFTQFDDGGLVSSWWGTTYTFLIVSNTGILVTFNPLESILGDATIGIGTDSPNTGITMTALKMIYTGVDWYVVSKNVILDANG